MKQSIFTRPLLGGVRRRAFAAFVAFAALASVAQAQTLHLVTVGNPEGFNEASAKKDVKKDLENVRDFFIANVPKNRLNLEAVDISNKTPRGVRAAIRSLEVKPDDVVVFYYTGHAGNQLDEAGHVFQLFEEGGKKEQRLPRKDVRADLALTQARLIVLLSDCCNAFIPTVSPKTPVVPAKEVSPVAQKLFFEPSGCVDITSSKLGQYSFTGDGGHGSLATAAWIKVFEEVNETLKDDPEADVDWKTVSETMIEKTEEMFKKKYPDGTTVQGDFQDAQTPHVYELPGAPRLGAKIQTRQQNLVVTKVVADSPAEKAGMQKGDILVAIRYLDSGKEIRPHDEADYADAIDYAPRDVEITVKRQNGKNTQQLILTVELSGLPMKKKEVVVDYLGVTVEGQEITDVVADSPAEKAGLKVGDKIETCDGAAIETGEDLRQALEAKPESATLGVVKKSTGKETDVVVNFSTPDPTPVDDSTPATVAELGVTLKGPEITEVVAGSPAANAGLQVGDKLVAYNGAPIQTGADVQNALDPKQFGAPVTVLKKSGGSEPIDLVVQFYRPGKPMFGATVQGQKITNVVPDSPAALAGLEVNDQMIAFNGATIKNAYDYDKAVDASPFHAQVVVLKTSIGQQVTVDVYLNRDPNGKPVPVPDMKGPVFGATVKGQELIAVVANSPAANAGLQVGDKILSFNGATINNAVDYEKAVDASPVNANLVVLKKGSAQQTNVFVRLNKTDTPPPVPTKVDPPVQQELTVDQTPARFGALFNGQAITKIVPGSPADKAGLKVGEKIVILNGETVQTAQAIAAGLGKTAPSDSKTWGRVLGLNGQLRDFNYTINQ